MRIRLLGVSDSDRAVVTAAAARLGHEVDAGGAPDLDHVYVVARPAVEGSAEGMRICVPTATFVWLVPDDGSAVEAAWAEEPDMVWTTPLTEGATVARLLAVERLRGGGRPEQRWAARVVDAVRDGVVVHRAGVLLFANAEMARMLRIPLLDLVGRPLLDFVPREDRAVAATYYSQPAGQRRELWVQRADGTRFLAELVSSEIPASGGPARLLLLRDLTDYKAAEQALRASHQRFQLVARVTKDIVYDWDCVSARIEWNDALREHWGYGPGAMPVDIHWWEGQIHPDDRERVLTSLEQTLAGGGEGWECEYRFRHADGSWRDVLDRGLVVRDAEGRPSRMIGVMSDLTERNRLHQQLYLAERMALVGTMAASVAHEINNPLTWTFGKIELAQEQLASLPASARLAAAQDSLHLAAEGAARIRGIVRDLRLFSRAPEDTLLPTDVRRVLESALTIAGPQIRERARVVRELEPVPPVLANEARLGQVFLNLLVNAAQAVPAGAPERHAITIATGVAHGRVVVDVRDTGVGIPPEVQGRIFEPFYTTKAPGEGTGLGLAIVREIVRQLGGDITLQSEVGRGTTFRVTLAAAPVEGPGESAPAPDAGPPRGRVLVIDDESMIVSFLKRAIELDHEVVGYTDPVAALAALRQGDDYDVILCDVMMPELTGTELWRVLQAERPALAARLVFITGGVYTPGLRGELDQAGLPVLEKPFEVRALLQLLRARVDAG